MKNSAIKTDAAFRRTADAAAKLITAIDKRKAEMKAKLAALKESPEATELAEWEAELKDKFDALKAYYAQEGAEARLCKPGMKYGEGAVCTFGVNYGRASIAPVEGKTEADAVAALEKEGRTEFLRALPPELNKAAIQGAGLTPEELLDFGLEMVREGKFYVKPKS